MGGEEKEPEMSESGFGGAQSSKGGDIHREFWTTYKASKDGEHEARKEGHRGSSSSAHIALPTRNQRKMKAEP